MLKRLVSSFIVSAFMAGTALAQAPTDADRCAKAAHDLAQMAESKNLSNEKLDKIEDLLGKMEDLCDADKVAEAMAIAKDIEAEINAQ